MEVVYNATIKAGNKPGQRMVLLHLLLVLLKYDIKVASEVVASSTKRRSLQQLTVDDLKVTMLILTADSILWHTGTLKGRRQANQGRC